jgi:hypothetical protein
LFALCTQSWKRNQTKKTPERTFTLCAQFPVDEVEEVHVEVDREDDEDDVGGGGKEDGQR